MTPLVAGLVSWTRLAAPVAVLVAGLEGAAALAPLPDSRLWAGLNASATLVGLPAWPVKALVRFENVAPLSICWRRKVRTAALGAVWKAPWYACVRLAVSSGEASALV